MVEILDKYWFSDDTDYTTAVATNFVQGEGGTGFTL